VLTTLHSSNADADSRRRIAANIMAE